MRKFIAAAAFLACFAIPAAPATGVKVGVLSCSIAGGVGYIITSSKHVNCVYRPASGSRHERYSGTVRKLGLDIGVTQRGSLVWAVFAPGKIRRGRLAGYYTGASAEATVAVGLGANVLIGGFEKNINLQPLSVQGQTGLNVALGLASLRLRYTGP